MSPIATDLTPDLEAFLDAHVASMLATQPAAGRARQSVVSYVRDGDRLLASTEATRVKARDVGETGWASIAQRFLGLDEPPEPQTGEALAAVGRVILAITIERVASINFVTS